LNKFLRVFLILALPVLAADDLVKTVSNDHVPVQGGKSLVLTPDLRFGADEAGDEYLWAHDCVVDADQRGHMFVADPEDSRLLEFDANGTFVRQVVRLGEGPGEARALRSAQFLNDGRLVVFDGRPGVRTRLHFFDDKLAFIETKRPDGYGTLPVSAIFSPTGERFAATYKAMHLEEGSLETMTGVLDADFRVLKEFTRVSQPANFQQFGDPPLLTRFIADLLKNTYAAGMGIMAFDGQGTLFSALSTKYEISKWDKNLDRKVLIIKCDYKPVRNPPEDMTEMVETLCEPFRQVPSLDAVMTKAFIQKVIEMADLPPIKSPVNGLICLPDGHLLVVHVVHHRSLVQVGDLFSPEGTFLGQVTMTGSSLMTPGGIPRMVFKKDQAYTVETDDKGNNRVVRYRYAIK